MMRKLLIVIAALGLIAAACGSAAESSDTSSAFDRNAAPAATEASAMADAPAAAEAASAADRAEESDGSLLGSGGVGGAPVVDLGRDIIFVASVTVAVEDVADASDAAVQAVTSFGGYVFGQQTTGAPNPRTVLTFKIRPDRFRDALAAIGSIGDLRSQVISADDVTERVVDLQSQITTAEVSVERLRELLAKATELKTITDVETQLLARETALERLRGSLRTLQDSVSLATITLTITEAFAAPDLDVSVTAYLGSDDTGESCPGDGSLSVDEGTDVTVCFEFVNTGDTMLSQFDLRDPVLDLTLKDLNSVFGSLDSPIEPGESIMLSTIVNVERNLQTRARVSAVPLNVDGEVLEGRAVSRTVGIKLRSVELDVPPGFADGFNGSIRFLTRVWQGLVLVLGVGLPLAVVGVPLWFVFSRLRRRQGWFPRPTPLGSDPDVAAEEETVSERPPVAAEEATDSGPKEE